MSAPMSSGPDSPGVSGLQSYTVVIPTIGRPGVRALLQTLDHAAGPRPDEVMVVDDRPGAGGGRTGLDLPGTSLPVRVMQSGGRGPAAARNTGWLAARTEWIAFLDDDVVIAHDWPKHLIEDLGRCGPSDAGSVARIVVPPPAGRPTDAQRNTMGLQGARWITADLAYRRSALVEVGGFDETFPRAYREDSDLALRMLDAGYRIANGRRVTEHPVPDPASDSWLASVRRQRGNADDATMLARHGAGWRTRAGSGRGRLWSHAVTTATGLSAGGLLLARRPRTAVFAAAVWAALTGRFAAQRIAPGPRTFVEIGRLLASSALIPPAACYHRLRGELAARFGSTAHPVYVWSTPSTPSQLRHPRGADPRATGRPTGTVDPGGSGDRGTGPSTGGPAVPRKDLP